MILVTLGKNKQKTLKLGMEITLEKEELYAGSKIVARLECASYITQNVDHTAASKVEPLICQNGCGFIKQILPEN